MFNAKNWIHLEEKSSLSSGPCKINLYDPLTKMKRYINVRKPKLLPICWPLTALMTQRTSLLESVFSLQCLRCLTKGNATSSMGKIVNSEDISRCCYFRIRYGDGTCQLCICAEGRGLQKQFLPTSQTWSLIIIYKQTSHTLRLSATSWDFLPSDSNHNDKMETLGCKNCK